MCDTRIVLAATAVCILVNMTRADDMAKPGQRFSAATPAPARRDKNAFDGRYTSTPCVVRLPDRYLLYYSARDWKTTYTDNKGRKGKDKAGIYAHIGVAVMQRK